MPAGPRLFLLLLAAAVTGQAAPVVPGPQADGTVLLHNQWPIQPVGTQVPLGDFPVTLALDPSGRYAAVLHAGYGPHQIQIVDLRTQTVATIEPVHEVFSGLAFSGDGRRLVCTGASDQVVLVYRFSAGHLDLERKIPLPTAGPRGVAAGLALAPDGHTGFATILVSGKIVRFDLDRGTLAWTTALDPPVPPAEEVTDQGYQPPDGPKVYPIHHHLVTGADPFGLAVDFRHHRLYASLWGEAAVAVLDTGSGAVLARWPAGLHPNELLLSADGTRLFVSNGGVNSVSVLATATGQVSETLLSSFSPADPPGSTPDSLCLGADGQTLFVANASNNNVAVFEVGEPGHGVALGFIPTGWYPTCVRLTAEGRRLLVLNARGLTPLPNAHLPGPGGPPAGNIVSVVAGAHGPEQRFPNVAALYHGSLAVIALPRARDFPATLRQWTAQAEACRPAAPAPPAAGNPVPSLRGGPTPFEYVIYIIKENRTYDQVFGDLRGGNGEPDLCLFPEAVTPNLHRLARQFVLLDNFYANAEISVTGHDWSMGAYAAEFIERTWPTNSGHKPSKVPYGGEGNYLAAVPALGYLWDRAAAAGVSYRSYGEFVHGEATPADPAETNLPALRGHIDPLYRGFGLAYSDVNRAARFISDLHQMEAAGQMPRLQIVRLPNDHTEAARVGALTPRAMVAQNDLAVGQVVEAITHSPFWPRTAIFIVEDDAQNGPDHVDAHRTEALVISPYTRRHAVDSTAYTTCSMLATMELILGLPPMSQFDALAHPMWAAFQARADLAPFDAVPNRVSLTERNQAATPAAALSAHFDFSREDANDDATFNRVLWAAMRGEGSVMPAPVHAAFVRALSHGGKDDDGDDDEE